jgi:hypothetical protein
MQCYTIFFIAVNALHVSGGFSAHHQELRFQNCTHSIWYVLSLLHATASVGELAVASNKEYCIALHLFGYTWKTTNYHIFTEAN